MSLIRLLESYEIEIPYDEDEKKEFEFAVPQGSDLYNIIITPSESLMEAQTSFSFKVAVTAENFEELKPDLVKEMKENTFRMRRALDKLLDHIQYSLNVEFGYPRLKVKKALFAIDFGGWEPNIVFDNPNIRIIQGASLNSESAHHIQTYLDNGEEPFVALKHLHRARQEVNPKQKIIEAAIAAELAIKEFLIKKYPDIKFLLMEMPSPPLNKLYGAVLEHYHNERYKKANKLQEIATLRNEYIHTIKKSKEITYSEASNKVLEVENAIKYLLSEIHSEHPWAGPYGRIYANKNNKK
ncbi:hypothetical protein AAV35_14095 [Salimicrobium jeotgali]|uniref:SEC-C motif domain protein n=1 Tax=Salimicrobium jeotgali TaxID=1230341 RepID=K2GKC0_9BACI|nr:hypothetical protein [Salimicrobium jeotgali]APC65557.1 hypothetical protein AAV35_14095 [Salimicrobium jeotgali]EKE30874.1 SEC-C motif domain protein [Salimicrobium jeotgali]MBM7697662.1 hypothetical protein [Salimicrobium jeotgali]